MGQDTRNEARSGNAREHDGFDHRGGRRVLLQFGHMYRREERTAGLAVVAAGVTRGDRMLGEPGCTSISCSRARSMVFILTSGICMSVAASRLKDAAQRNQNH
jgi:hypothetical protein